MDWLGGDRRHSSWISRSSAGLEAAQAGQLHPWKLKSMGYKAQTSYLGELAGWLAGDRKVT